MTKRIRIGGGRCGCGYLGTCYEDFACGCSWDHGDFHPCVAHELERQADELAHQADTVSDWARDEQMLDCADGL